MMSDACWADAGVDLAGAGVEYRLEEVQAGSVTNVSKVCHSTCTFMGPPA